jgi:hypothetical protein
MVKDLQTLRQARENTSRPPFIIQLPSRFGRPYFHNTKLPTHFRITLYSPFSTQKITHLFSTSPKSASFFYGEELAQYSQVPLLLSLLYSPFSLKQKTHLFSASLSSTILATTSNVALIAP